MDIKLIAAPLDMGDQIEKIEAMIEKSEPFFICINLNQLVEDGFSEKQILELVSSIQRGQDNSLHILQPKDNQFHYTNEWLRSLYHAWDRMDNVLWWQPSKIE
jgi:hypothetical protein